MVDGAEIRVLPVGDIQYAGLNGATDLERLRSHIGWGVSHNCYFVGMGDYVDFASPSNRARLQGALLYDSAQEVIDQAATSLEQQLFAVLAPSKGRWLGLVQGHHFFPHLDGTTTDTRLAQFLGCPFLGDCGVVILRFPHEGKTAIIDCKIWVHHGAGSGFTAASVLSALERKVIGFEADVYLMGHRHERLSRRLPRLYPIWHKGRARLIQRIRILACTGGWMEGYMLGHEFESRAQGIYVEKRMLNPVALGGPCLYIRPRIKSGYVNLDLDILT